MTINMKFVYCIMAFCILSVAVYASSTQEDINSNPVIKIFGADATLNTWLGTTSSDWSTASNWNQGYVPNITTPVVLNGSATYQPYLSNDSYAYNITMLSTIDRLSTNGYNLEIDESFNGVVVTTSSLNLNLTGNLTIKNFPSLSIATYGIIEANTSYFNKPIYIKFRDEVDNGFSGGTWTNQRYEVRMFGTPENYVYMTTTAYPSTPTNYFTVRGYTPGKDWYFINTYIDSYSWTTGAYLYADKYWENVTFSNIKPGGATILNWYVYQGAFYKYKNITTSSEKYSYLYDNQYMLDVRHDPFFEDSGNLGKIVIRATDLKMNNSYMTDTQFVLGANLDATIYSNNHNNEGKFNIFISSIHTYTSAYVPKRPYLYSSESIIRPTSIDDLILNNTGTEAGGVLEVNVNLSVKSFEGYTDSINVTNSSTFNITDTLTLTNQEIYLSNGRLIAGMNSGLVNRIDSDVLGYNVWQYDSDSCEPYQTDPAGYQNVTSYAGFENTSADSWYDIKLYYNESLVTNESKLTLLWYSSDTSTWSAIFDTPVIDDVNNYIQANITEFDSGMISLLGVFESTATTPGTTSDYPLEALPFTTVIIAFTLLFIARRLDSNDAMKILYFMLAIVFIIITLFTNRILAEGEGYTDIVNLMTNSMNVVIFIFVILLMFFIINFFKDIMSNWSNDRK